MAGQYNSGVVAYNAFGDNNGPRNQSHIVAQPNGPRNQAHIVSSRTSVDGAGQPDSGQTEHHKAENNRNSYVNQVQQSRTEATRVEAVAPTPIARCGSLSGQHGLGTGESRGMGGR